MATFNDATTGISNAFEPYFTLFGSSSVSPSFGGSTELTLSIDGASADGVITLTGVGMGFNGLGFVGTVTGFAFSVNGTPLYAVTDLSLALSSVATYVLAGNSTGLFNALYGADDTFNLDNAVTGTSNAMFGGAGNDTFNYGAGWSNAELDNGGVDGGSGSDTLVLNGAYADPIWLFENDNIVSVETVLLGAGNSYAVALRGAGGYGRLTVDGSNLLSTDQLFIGSLIGDVDTTGLYTILGGGGADQLAGSDKTGAGDTISGNGGVDHLFGNAGNDTLNGGDGNDNIVGGLGNDTMNGDNGNDTIDLRDGGADVANGGVGNDTFLLAFGNNGFDIDGGTGTDKIVLTGTLPSATFSGDVTNVELIDINVNGDVSITIGNTVVAAGKTLTVDATGLNNASEDLLFNGAGELNGKLIVKGGAGADRITGGGVVDTLLGNAGNDILNGGKGSDTLTGGAGKDKFLFNSALGASNVDKITDFSVPNDTIQLENAIFKNVGAAGLLKAQAFWTGASAHDASDRIIYNANTGALYYDADGIGAAAAIKFATLSTHLGLTNADFVVV